MTLLKINGHAAGPQDIKNPVVIIPGTIAFWLNWFFILAGIFMVFYSTIAIAPFLHKDEFIIVDLGRIILHPSTDWSIAWMSEYNEPVLFWSYLGPVIQETFFNMLGEFGPRISGIIGAMSAATLVMMWLSEKGLQKNISVILALVFLLDPLFVQAYTMGRVDGWAMAMCISSCWILVSIYQRSMSVRRQHLLLAVAGALAVTGFFVWPSSIFLYPLVLLELFYVIRRSGVAGQSKSNALHVSIYFLAGAILATIIILSPILHRLLEHLYIIVNGLKMNTSKETYAQQSFSTRIVQSVLELFRIFKFTAALLLIALIAFIRKKEYQLLLAFVIAILIMVLTLVYIHRVQYLVPYLIAAIASLYLHSGKNKDILLGSIFKDIKLLAILVWSIGLSLVARTILAFDDYGDKGRELVLHAARDLIGKRPATVFSTYEFYYTGRALGWKMFKPYFKVGEINSPPKLQPVLLRVDFAIVNVAEVTDELLEQFENDGLIDRGLYKVYPVPSEKDDGTTDNIRRLRNLYSIFRKPYGPYRLYSRKL